MPTYEYEKTGTNAGCDTCRQRFEWVQPMSEAALNACPDCGGSVERVFSAAMVHGGGDILSNKNLGEKGFTKYVKAGDGYYEKTAGKGPKVIKR